MYLIVFENYQPHCSPVFTEGMWKGWTGGYVDIYKHINNKFFVLSTQKTDMPFTDKAFWKEVEVKTDENDPEMIV